MMDLFGNSEDVAKKKPQKRISKKKDMPNMAIPGSVKFESYTEPVKIKATESEKIEPLINYLGD